MAKEKNVDAEKLPQDNRDNERLTNSELDGVAGGAAGTGESKGFGPQRPKTTGK